MIRRLKRAFEKNWHEVDAALHGGMFPFVYLPRPAGIGASVPVFCYHRIDAVSFGADLAYLMRNGYTAITADALADHVSGLSRARERSVVISIDDGMEDLYRVAFPLLREFGMKAVAFVCPGLHEEFPAEEGPRRLCTWGELGEMHASGLVDIQSHTYEHRYVPRWPRMCGMATEEGPIDLPMDAPALPLEEDLARSKRVLEERLGKRVFHLAFPQYDGTEEAIRLGRAAGYQSFWWGLLRRRKGNFTGDPLSHVVRISGEFVRRLPGRGRVPLSKILGRRVGRSLSGRHGILATRARPAPAPAALEHV